MCAAAAYWPSIGRYEAWAGLPNTPGIRDREKADRVAPGIYESMLERGELRLHPGRTTPVSRFIGDLAARLEGAEVALVGADRYRVSEVLNAIGAAEVRRPFDPAASWRGTGAGSKAQGSADVRAFQRAIIGGKLRSAEPLLPGARSGASGTNTPRRSANCHSRTPLAQRRSQGLTGALARPPCGAAASTSLTKTKTVKEVAAIRQPKTKTVAEIAAPPPDGKRRRKFGPNPGNQNENGRRGGVGNFSYENPKKAGEVAAPSLPTAKGGWTRAPITGRFWLETAFRISSQ